MREQSFRDRVMRSAVEGYARSARAPICLRRSVQFIGADIEVEVVLPAAETPREVVMAGRELDAAAREINRSCGHCGAPWGHVHFPDCPLLDDDFIAGLHAEAVTEGMRP